LDDADLIARARQGDAEAWGLLVPAYQQVVYRLAYLLLGDVDEAEDVAQEAFLRALRAIDRFDLSRPLCPWLLSITANLARNRRRSISRYMAAVRRAFQAGAERQEDVGTLSGRTSDAQALWQATRRLDRIDQEVIYLRFFLEMPVSETAEVLGVAQGTVKSRLHRALARLRTIVERDFPYLIEEYGDERASMAGPG
jgi:RNA polymerase sigma-70 factor (ECF subfamily)